MKKIITLSLCFFTLISYSQTSKNLTVNKIKIFLNTYSYFPDSPNKSRKTVVYFNKVDNILDIDNYRIPLSEVKTTYFFFKEYDAHCIWFSCKEGVECITKPDEENVVGFKIPIKSKKNCYDFIELIEELKK